MGLLDLFLSTKKWFLRNEDTNDVIEGQFPAQNLNRSVKNNWAKHTSLGRTNAVLQFLSGESDTISFQSIFYAENMIDAFSLQDKIDKLIEFSQKDSSLGRPPIVTFWVGDGHLEQTSVIDSISGINYQTPTVTGQLRSVSFTVNLVKYEEFSIGDKGLFDTRYHKARERDYYELVAYREYKNPLLGDVIRKNHPDQTTVTVGNTIKLPSVERVRTERVQPKSNILNTAFGRKDTPQRALRIDTLDDRNRTYVSHILVE